MRDVFFLIRSRLFRAAAKEVSNIFRRAIARCLPRRPVMLVYFRLHAKHKTQMDTKTAQQYASIQLRLYNELVPLFGRKEARQRAKRGVQFAYEFTREIKDALVEIEAQMLSHLQQEQRVE